jgi:CheY-like chemotaxis protein
VTQVILIDDDDLVRHATLSMLGRWYEVVAFANPIDALAHIKGLNGRRPIIVCDYDMPQLNGREVFDRLGDEHRNRFILFTGNPTVECPPGAHLLFKPMGAMDLRTVIKKMEAA